jgi:magnesium chelatase family protein
MQGIDALPCEVEIDFNETVEEANCRTIVVGLPDAAVKESSERVRAALANSGFHWPKGRTIINLAPADVRKEGPTYDLPIAVAMLIMSGRIRPARGADAKGLDHRTLLFGGELSLDGRPIGRLSGAVLLAQRLPA